jgi:hypothetical protein
MPTPESAAAFKNLVTVRTRLNQIAAQMKQHLDRGESMTPPYRELQRLWDNALMELETAAEEYSNAVKQFHDEVSVVEERDVS